MKKSVIIAFFVLIVALILILAIICGKALFAKNLIVNTYQSSNFGITVLPMEIKYIIYKQMVFIKQLWI